MRAAGTSPRASWTNPRGAGRLGRSTSSTARWRRSDRHGWRQADPGARPGTARPGCRKGRARGGAARRRLRAGQRARHRERAARRALLPRVARPHLAGHAGARARRRRCRRAHRAQPARAGQRPRCRRWPRRARPALRRRARRGQRALLRRRDHRTGPLARPDHGGHRDARSSSTFDEDAFTEAESDPGRRRRDQHGRAADPRAPRRALLRLARRRRPRRHPHPVPPLDELLRGGLRPGATTVWPAGRAWASPRSPTRSWSAPGWRA
jgi:hypothetical protein